MGTIIGLSGKAGSGKDTFAGFLRDYNPNIVRRAFADALKIHLGDLTGWTFAQLQDQQFKQTLSLRYGTTPRAAMQSFGVWARETLGSDFWVNKVLNARTPDEITVVTDVRFRNEANAIRAAGGYLVRIDRASCPVGDHISETDLDNYDFNFFVGNNGTTLELKDVAFRLLQYLRVIQ